VGAAAKADLVRIYRLQGIPADMTPKRFPILPYESEHPTFGSTELKDEDMDRFMGSWREFPVDSSNGALCHFPLYGFQFYKRNKLIFETSVCWACENFYVDTWFFGSNWISFDSTSQPSRELFEFCDALLPYDRNYIERIKKEREAFI